MSLPLSLSWRRGQDLNLRPPGRKLEAKATSYVDDYGVQDLIAA